MYAPIASLAQKGSGNILCIVLKKRKKTINCLEIAVLVLGQARERSKKKNKIIQPSNDETKKQQRSNLVTKHFVHFGFEMHIFIQGDHFVDALN